MLDKFSLKGQTALITGSTGGLGSAICEVLAESGADVIINHLSQPDEADALRTTVEKIGSRACVVQADVSREDEVNAMFKIIERTGQSVDILINNAGISQPKDIFTMELDDWNRVMRVNLTSCFLCSRAAMRMMRERGSGRIVNISSVVAHRGAIHGHAHYAASKSGMLGLTVTLARTGAPLGITVNALAPGIIDTGLLHETLGEETVEKLTQSVPIGSLGTPRDVAYAAAYLCSPAARYLTGVTLDVNGGLYFH